MVSNYLYYYYYKSDVDVCVVIVWQQVGGGQYEARTLRWLSWWTQVSLSLLREIT